MGLFGISFGKSKSSSTSTSNSSSFNQGENFSNSGSEQGSASNSYGIDQSQSGQSIYGGQEPYLQALYANAANLYNNYGMPEQQVAGLNPYLQNALDQRYSFSQGVGNDIFTKQLNSSLNNLASYGTAADTASRMAAGNVYGSPQVDNANYGSAGQLAGMGSFSRGAQANLNFGLINAIANNPYLNGQIDAASQDVVRNLGENQLTGNAAMAAGTGNSGSSRRAVMDAIAQRGAADRIANIASTMRGNAYQQGVQTAADQAALNANLRQNNQQYNAGQYNSLLGQGAGFSQNQALQNAALRQQTNSINAGLMQSGADLAYRLGQAGTTGLNSAYTLGSSNIDQAQGAGDYLRQYQQQLLDTAFKNQMNPYTGLQMYQSFIGGPTVLASSNSLGLQGSASNSFGNSFSNGYSYDLGGANSSSNATSNSSSFNLGFGK